MIWKLKNLMNHCNEVQTCIHGQWMPARPIGYTFLDRLRAAWQVLKGRADAFVWPEDQ